MPAQKFCFTRSCSLHWWRAPCGVPLQLTPARLLTASSWAGTLPLPMHLLSVPLIPNLYIRPNSDGADSLPAALLPIPTYVALLLQGHPTRTSYSRVKCWLALPGVGNILITRFFRFLLTGTISWAEGTSSSDAELLQWPGKGALAAGSPHVTPTRHDLGSQLMCVGPTSLWQASRILWFTGGDVWVFQKYAREERTDEGIWKRCTYGFLEG